MSLNPNARPIKNIEFAAKAVSRVKSNKRIHFLYIGAYDDSFKQRLENINPGNTIVTGPIPEAKRYAGILDIFVSPTKEPGEGFGLAITEAMMSSVPVVATQFGGATDIVEHGKTGFLLPENALSWENALQKLADDTDLRKQMGRAAQIRVLDRFSLDVVAANFIRILNDVIAENQ